MKHTPFYLITTVLMLIFYSCNKNTDRLIKPVDFNITDSEPAWSPNGQWIAFVHGSMPNEGIYLIRPDGTGNWLWHSGMADSPAWSPCGQWIAFSQNAQIWKKKIDGDSLTRLTSEGRNFFPVWNISGIAYRRSYSWPEESTIQGIWLLKPISSKYTHQIFSGNCGMPVWLSIDRLGFFRGVVNEFGSTIGFSFYDIFIETLECNEITFLPNVRSALYPKFSAIKNSVAFTSQLANSGFPHIRTMNADGSTPKQITFFPSYGCDWSPCGNYIVYTDVREENGRLWIMNADGTGNRQLTFEHHF